MINLDWLSTSFQISAIPKHWKCPNCKKGGLVLQKDRHIKNVISECRTVDHIYDYAVYRFVGLLQCDNKACEDVINIAGTASDEDYEDYDKEGFPYMGIRIGYEVNYFYPPLMILDLPNELDNKIKDVLIKAFGHYWNDLESSANKIRIAIEMILDDLGVKKFTINKNNKRVAISTHSRIILFGVDNSDVASKMLAIKWIGNDGSHVGGELSRSDLFTDFELLDYIIEKLYTDRDKRLAKIASQINKNKGLEKVKKKSK